jgi:hypothetical protein
MIRQQDTTIAIEQQKSHKIKPIPNEVLSSPRPSTIAIQSFPIAKKTQKSSHFQTIYWTIAPTPHSHA